MKFKKSILITLVALIIVCLGVVSASDVSTNETITETNNTECILEPQNEDTISANENEDTISENDDTLSKKDKFLHIRNVTCTSPHYDGSLIEFENRRNHESYAPEEGNILLSNDFAYVSGDISGESYLGNGETINGTIILSIDGNPYYNKTFDGVKDAYTLIEFNTLNLNLPDNLKTGNHNVVLTYLKNGVLNYTMNKTVKFLYEPQIEYSYSDDKLIFTIEYFPLGSTVETSIYDSTSYENIDGVRHNQWEGYLVTNSTIKNGKANIVIDNFKPSDVKYKYIFYLKVDGNTYKVYKSFTIDNLKNTISNTNSNQNSSSTTSNTNSNENSKITKLNTKITAKKTTFKAKKSKKYTVTLKVGTKAVKNVKVFLKINGKTYKATTNKYGKATFKIKLNKKGTFNTKITFKGNKNYKATSKTVKIKIK